MRKAVAVLLVLTGCASTAQRDDEAAINASRAKLEALVTREKIPGAAVAVTVGDR
jgi:hypothetical protein